jgi:hypothetical protein
MAMDAPEAMHRKIVKVVRLQCQDLCRRLGPASTDPAAIESSVSEQDLEELLRLSRAWQNAAKFGDRAVVEKCESDFTTAWETFEATAKQASSQG